jgi:subtilisin family serine protease
MNLTKGVSQIAVGLIDGPVDLEHSDFVGSKIVNIPGKASPSCQNSDSYACLHGTFVARMLSARPGSDTPAICSACTLLVRPIFRETPIDRSPEPSANPDELAAAITDCIGAGARVINLSLALVRHSNKVESALQSALDEAMRRGVIIVAAAGNQSDVGGGVITRHPWVIPVAACDRRGLPATYSNSGHSIGGRGLRAPGDGFISSSSATNLRSFSGTSVSAPFVTGTVALLWSLFPFASSQEIRFAVTNAAVRRASIIPPLLDAGTAYETLSRKVFEGRTQ